jgi:HSP20 family protein
MSKTPRRNPNESLASDILLGPNELMARLALGNWIPNVDICEVGDAILVRVELPGIQPEDVRITMRGNLLRVQGIKREPAVVRKRISYFCLERRYGKFDRQISIDWVVDSGKCHARLWNGILTVEIPKMENRRGKLFEIPINSEPE